MPLIDVHTVVAHVVLHLVDDLLTSSFNSKYLPSLHNVVSFGLSKVDSWGQHYLSQPVPLDKELMLALILLLLGNDCTNDGVDSFDAHTR